MLEEKSWIPALRGNERMQFIPGSHLSPLGRGLRRGLDPAPPLFFSSSPPGFADPEQNVEESPRRFCVII
jgi:hypothetical protein